MDLSEAKVKKTYFIEEVSDESESFRIRAAQLGLVAGQIVTLKHCAPIFKDPMLFQVENSLIALTKDEAKMIRASLQEN